MAIINRRSPYRNWRMDQAWGQNFTINRASPQYNGLVAWWPSLKGVGGVTLQDMLQRSAGANVDVVWSTDAQHGVVLDYNGASSYTAVNHPEVLDTTYNGDGLSPFSISYWMNGPPNATDTEFSLGNSADTIPTFFIGTHVIEEGMDVFLRDDSNNALLNHVRSTTTVHDNTWHHIVWEDHAGDAKMYIDGVLDATDFSYVPVDTYTLDRATWGAFRRVVLAQYYSGFLTDMRIYNRELSSSEAWNMWAPSTRWDLYKPTPRAFFMSQLAVGIPMPIIPLRGIHSVIGGGQIVR